MEQLMNLHVQNIIFSANCAKLSVNIQQETLLILQFTWTQIPTTEKTFLQLIKLQNNDCLYSVSDAMPARTAHRNT